MNDQPPVHVDVVLPEHVWARMHLTATARGATIAGVIAEAIIRQLAAERTADPMDQILDDIDRARTRHRMTGVELVDEVDQLLSLGLNPREICRELDRTAAALEHAARRASRPDIATKFYSLAQEPRIGATA